MGVALFRRAELIHCTAFEASGLTQMLSRVHGLPLALRCERFSPSVENINEIVIELPQVYGKSGKGDPNDLIRVAAIAGVVAGRFDVKTNFVLPRTWKGQTPKPISHARARDVLSEREQKIVDSVAKGAPKEDVWDAVAIGLWALNRTIKQKD